MVQVLILATVGMALPTLHSVKTALQAHTQIQPIKHTVTHVHKEHINHTLDKLIAPLVPLVDILPRLAKAFVLSVLTIQPSMRIKLVVL